MALYELDEFQGPALLGFVRTIPTPSTFRGSEWLPTRTIDELAFEYIKGSNRKPVMAHVMGWDSEAPIHGREPLGERVQGELPPIKRKAKFSEKEIIRFLQPRASSADVQTAIDSVYQLTGDLVRSVQARIEWLQLKALSEDTIVYDEGGVEFGFDFGINDEYQLNLTNGQDGDGNAVTELTGVAWSDTANADPITDMTYIADKVEDETGARPALHVMPRATLGLLLNNAKVRSLIRGSSAPDSLITRQELDVLFDLYNLPPITTYDLQVRSEQADGTFTDVRPLAKHKTFMIPPGTVDLGETLLGPTAESRSLIGTNLATAQAGIFAVTYGKEEPPSEWTKVVATAFPSMPGAENLVQLQPIAAA